MFFASGNAGPAHLNVMQALVAANEGYMPAYDADAITVGVTRDLRALFVAA